MILSNSWPVKIVYVRWLVLIYLLSFVFQMIPNFELMSDTFINFEVAWIALLAIFTDKWVFLIDETCLMLALVTLAGISPCIGTTSTNLAILRASTTSLCALVIFLVVDRKVQETTWARGKKWVAHLAILPPDWRGVTLVLVVSLLLHLLLVCELKVTDYNLVLLFPAVMATKEVTRVTSQIDDAQLVEAFEKCISIVSPNTK
jgi:hypothetical protein